MYINFWYPIAKSEEVSADEPFRAEIFGLKFVAFRDGDGAAHVLSDTCVHRGGSLSKGWVKDGCVVCPYHGWRYEGDGRCTTVPSLGYDAKAPARAKVDSYPVQERYGILFAFLGDLPEEERPTLYEIEEWGQEGWRANELIVFDVDYYYERSIENGLDPAHNEFVHPTHGYSGEKGDYRVPDFTLEEWPQGPWFECVMDSSEYKDGTMQKIRETAGKTIAGTGTHGPNMMVTKIHLTDTNWFHQYIYEAPVDENRTRIFFVNMRNCLLDPKYDEHITTRNMDVAHQDIDILTELDPVRTPESNIKEVLTPSDKAVVAYRDWKQIWDDKGWRIDLNALRAARGDVAVAVPCPERRTSGNWVLDEVPRLPAAQEQKAAAE